MVWFYLYYQKIISSAKRDFQSHYGLILSSFFHSMYCRRWELSIPLWSDFIVGVFLTPRYATKNFQSHYGLILSFRRRRRRGRRRCCFQSHYGLILSRRLLIQGSCCRSSFNPTMVWFYLLILHLETHIAKSFQSHYGLILSYWFVKVNRNWSIRLSIPLWSDFISLMKKVFLRNPVHFQSHYGLILSGSVMKLNYLEKILSIPLWSDFICRVIK